MGRQKREAGVVNISLCMVVRNEEKRIYDCLSRIIAYVHDIVIVDQQSLDNTVDELLAIKTSSTSAHHKITIITDICSGICETSRQESLYRANFDWRIVLDADEYFEDPNCLQYLANSGESYLYGFKRKNLIDNKEMTFMGNDYQPRLLYKNIEWPCVLHDAPYHPSRKNTDHVLIHERSYDEVMSDQARYMTQKNANINDHKNFINQVNKTLGK